MWWKVTGDVKCPRGDCIYHSYDETSAPCSGCNANMRNKSNMGKSFNFKSKDVDPWLEAAATKAEKEGGLNGQGNNKSTSTA